MNTWLLSLRAVIPPKYLAWAIVAYLVIVAPVVICWSMGVPNPAETQFPAIIVLVSLAGAYGGYRVWSRHPAVQADYREWLSRTPWTSTDPLPFGPVHIVWHDIVLLAVVELLAWFHALQITEANATTLDPFFVRHALLALSWPVMAFLVVQLAAIMAICIITQVHAVAAWLFFGLGLVLYTIHHALLAFTLAVAWYTFAWVGIRHSLRFVWMNNVHSEDRIQSHRRSQSRQTLGWPYRGLGPSSEQDFTSLSAPWSTVPWRRGAAVVAALVGWWCYVLLTVAARLNPSFDSAWAARPRLMFLTLIAFSFLVALLRLSTYSSAYRPPITLAGRILTGRWVIPGYDVVYLAPAVIVLVSVIAFAVQYATSITPRIAFSISAGIAVWLALTLAPTLRVWQLTGHHRLSPRAFNPPATKQ
jgi:hypothetical protein